MIPLLHALTLMLLWLSASLVHAERCEDPRPLRLSLIPLKDLATQQAQYRPLIRQLELALARRVEAVPAVSYGAVVEGLLNDSIDVAELGPASYVMATGRGARIEPIATFRLQPGALTRLPTAYHSVLITRRDGRRPTLARLRGATLSLIDPASTSGAILPRHAMREVLGEPIDTYFSQITYAGSHVRAIEVLHKGLVDAAFVASTAVDDAIRKGRLQQDEIQVLWTSAPIPYDPFVARTRLCADLRERIRQVFLGDATPLQGMFKDLGMNGFAPTTDAAYQPIRMLYPARP